MWTAWVCTHRGGQALLCAAAGEPCLLVANVGTLCHADPTAFPWSLSGIPPSPVIYDRPHSQPLKKKVKESFLTIDQYLIKAREKHEERKDL